MFYLVRKSYLTLKGKSNILFNLKENGEKRKPEKINFQKKKKVEENIKSMSKIVFGKFLAFSQRK